MSEKWHQSEICIVINDKSQGNIAKNLSWDDLLHCKFITQFAGDRIFLNRQTFGEVAGKMINSPYTFELKDAELAI